MDIDEEFEEQYEENIRKNESYKLTTNRRYNCVSYYMMSDWDCYTLCLNTHRQIAEMANSCEMAAGQMFLFWHRMYTYCSFEQQSTYFGVSSSQLCKWWKQTKQKLCEWSNKYLINGDVSEPEQPWTAKKIQNCTPNFITRLHDPDRRGHVIVTMDGTYIKTQQNQKNIQLRQLMWSSQKDYTLVKPHLICTLGGLLLLFGDVYLLFIVCCF